MYLILGYRAILSVVTCCYCHVHQFVCEIILYAVLSCVVLCAENLYVLTPRDILTGVRVKYGTSGFVFTLCKCNFYCFYVVNMTNILSRLTMY